VKDSLLLQGAHASSLRISDTPNSARPPYCFTPGPFQRLPGTECSSPAGSLIRADAQQDDQDTDSEPILHFLTRQPRTCRLPTVRPIFTTSCPAPDFTHLSSSGWMRTTVSSIPRSPAPLRQNSLQHIRTSSYRNSKGRTWETQEASNNTRLWAVDEGNIAQRVSGRRAAQVPQTQHQTVHMLERSRKTPGTKHTAASRISSMPLLKRRALVGTIHQAYESVHSSDSPRCDSSNTDADHVLSANTGASPDCAPMGSHSSPSCTRVLGLTRSSLLLAHDQVQKLNQLEEERDIALQAMLQEPPSARGLRGILPVCCPAAVQSAVCKVEERRRQQGDSQRARPCEVAARCRSTYTERGASTSTSTTTDKVSAPSADAQLRHVQIPVRACSPVATTVALTEDGRDADGRCVDKDAYKCFYGFWPSREAMLTFAEYSREVAVPPLVSKKAWRKHKRMHTVMCEQRAASELHAIGFPARGSKPGFHSMRRTSDSLRCNGSGWHGCLELVSRQGVVPISTSGQLPTRPHDPASQDTHMDFHHVDGRTHVVNDLDGVAQDLSSSQEPSLEHGPDCTHSTHSRFIQAWMPEVRRMDDTCRCGSSNHFPRFECTAACLGTATGSSPSHPFVVPTTSVCLGCWHT
jgi:hypothetical protein